MAIVLSTSIVIRCRALTATTAPPSFSPSAAVLSLLCSPLVATPPNTSAAHLLLPSGHHYDHGAIYRCPCTTRHQSPSIAVFSSQTVMAAIFSVPRSHRHGLHLPMPPSILSLLCPCTQPLLSPCHSRHRPQPRFSISSSIPLLCGRPPLPSHLTHLATTVHHHSSGQLAEGEPRGVKTSSQKDLNA